MISYDQDRSNGVKNYKQDLRHLRRVADGAFEGAIPALQHKAEELLQIERGLQRHRRRSIIKVLANKPRYALEKMLEKV